MALLVQRRSSLPPAAAASATQPTTPASALAPAAVFVVHDVAAAAAAAAVTAFVLALGWAREHAPLHIWIGQGSDTRTQQVHFVVLGVGAGFKYSKESTGYGSESKDG